MTDPLSSLLGDGGALSSALAGFSPRPQQLEMAQAIEHTLRDGGVFACEAGTGTGKTLAYLIPALRSPGRTLISTGTRHLQNQLYDKDLPLAAQVTGRRVHSALLKGRNNYLCLYRLRLNLETPDSVDRRAGSDLVLIREWSTRTRDGDVAELAEVAEGSPAWPLATSTRDNCLGSTCEHYDRCHLFQARRRAADADLVVVNHHLLLAQFVLDREGHGELLPEVDALVVDEAHQLPDLASEFLGTTLGSGQLMDLCRDADMARRVEARDMSQLSSCAGALELAVRELRLSFGSGVRRITWHDLSTDKSVRVGLDCLAGALSRLGEVLDAASERGRACESCAQRAHALSARLLQLCAAQPADHLSWIDVSMRGFTWRLSPLDVAGVLGPRLRQSYRTLVFTSATLAVGGNLDHYLSRSGLPEAGQAVLASPFDYARQSLLFVPKDMPEPADGKFTEILHDLVRELLAASRGRAFVLFTSHLALRRARQDLAPTLPFPVLAQGEGPRAELLERFRRLGDAVLLGTYSFWEGVDVRGDALSCVIIDKLPFAPPGDPLLRARLDRMREAGEDPFRHHQLPQAALVLKQGVGRLIRDTGDRGVVAICDARIVSRGYGKALLASLPPMPLTRELSVVRNFFDGVE